MTQIGFTRTFRICDIVDGVCEDIITELARFPEIFVIARNSSFSFKGRSVTHHDVARDLSVRYILEGSLRRAADRLRHTLGQPEASGPHLAALAEFAPAFPDSIVSGRLVLYLRPGRLNRRRRQTSLSDGQHLLG